MLKSERELAARSAFAAAEVSPAAEFAAVTPASTRASSIQDDGICPAAPEAVDYFGGFR